MTADDSATVTYVTWREHIWNFGALQRVSLSLLLVLVLETVCLFRKFPGKGEIVPGTLLTILSHQDV
jgi:hypothetical protein